jgi:hypothetical protein
MSTFKFAGVSRLPNGTVKARFANDALRVKVLQKGGHTDIDLVEFVTALTKEQAVAKLIEMDFAKGRAEVVAALEAEVDKRSPKAANKQPKKTKEAKKPKKDTTPAKGEITLDGIMNKMAKPSTENLEDAPF